MKENKLTRITIERGEEVGIYYVPADIMLTKGIFANIAICSRRTYVLNKEGITKIKDTPGWGNLCEENLKELDKDEKEDNLMGQLISGLCEAMAKQLLSGVVKEEDDEE